MTAVPLYCYYELSPHPLFPNTVIPHHLLKITGNVWQEFTSHCCRNILQITVFPLPFLPQLLTLISGSLTCLLTQDRLCGLEAATGLRHSPMRGLPALGTVPAFPASGGRETRRAPSRERQAARSAHAGSVVSSPRCSRPARHHGEGGEEEEPEAAAAPGCARSPLKAAGGDNSAVRLAPVPRVLALPARQPPRCGRGLAG